MAIPRVDRLRYHRLVALLLEIAEPLLAHPLQAVAVAEVVVQLGRQRDGELANHRLKKDKLMRNTIIKTTITLLLASSVGLLAVRAQSPADAYRNVQQGIYGTAKAQALGGAVGAIGADPTAVSVNPAGSSLYNRAVFTIGFDIGQKESTVDWINQDLQQSVSRKLSLSRLGDISYFSSGHTFNVGNNNTLKLNWGVTNRHDLSYKRDYEMLTGATNFSITDYISTLANDAGLPSDRYIRTDNYDPFTRPVNALVALGLNGDIITEEKITDNATGKVISHSYMTQFYERDDAGNIFPMPIRATNLNVSEHGYRNVSDFNLSLGYNHTYLFGVSLRVASHTFRRSSLYREDFDDVKGTQNSFMEYGSNLNVSGNSLGLNIGFLAAIGDYGRVGISYLTPQYAHYEELYSASTYNRLNTVIDPSNREYIFNTGEYRSEYSMLLPGQLTISAMAFLSRFGMISYDFQYRNLGNSAIMHAKTLDKSGVSDFIKEDYGKELTHKVGLEVRPVRWLSLRAGYQHSGNPLKATQLKQEPEGGLAYDATSGGLISDFILPRAYQAITAGVGFSIGRSIAIDMAYVNESRTQKVYPYTGYVGINPDEFVVVKGGNLKEVRNSFVGTFTIRF